MSKEMLINVSEGEECRIALLEKGRVEELYMERTSATSHVGNIYKGRVTNVEASIQAAFVDFGLGRNGFLHISDLMPSYFGREGGDIQESVGRKLSRRDRPPIQRCLRRGDEIVVQIIKEGIGTKGPTLSTYVSIPGRILVMMPGMAKFGVSRKIEDEDERRRLRQILDGCDPIDDVGFIIRTAGIGKTQMEIERDLTYLTRLWHNIQRKMRDPAPVQLYTEGDLVTRTVRDVYSTDLSRIVVDNRDIGRRIQEFFKIAMPRTSTRIEMYESPVPLFHQANIEREIEQMYSRHVPLPSGGSLVIDSTEAVVAIDVNSGKFRDHNDAEMTAFKTDMEAADEIPRQLKLRDLGGVIICDFIDLRFERHRRELEERLHSNFKNDRAKTKVLRMSQFGIIELTRQRMRPSLKRSIYFDCPNCKGAGLVKTPESMSIDVMRRLAIAAYDARVARVELTVCPDVGVYVLNKKRAELTALESDSGRPLIVKQDIKLGLDEVKMKLTDARGGFIYLEELGMEPGEERDEVRAVEPRKDRRGRGRGRPLPNSRSQEGVPHHDDEVDDLDQGEDAVEQRDDILETDEPDLAVPPTKPRAVSRAPLGKVIGVLLNDIEEEKDEAESSVIEVDEPNEPLGDGPEEFEEDRERRWGRGSGGGGREGGSGSRDQRRDNRPRYGDRPVDRVDNRIDNRSGERPVDRVDNRGGERPVDRDNRGNRLNGAVPGIERPVDRGGEPRGNGEGGTRRRRSRRGRRGRGGQGGQFDGPNDRRPVTGAGGEGPHPDDEPLDLDEEHADAAFGTGPGDHESVGAAGEEIDGPAIDAEFDEHDADAPAGPGTPVGEGDPDQPRKRRRRRRGGRRHRRRRDGLEGAPGLPGEAQPADGAVGAGESRADHDDADDDLDDDDDLESEIEEAVMDDMNETGVETAETDEADEELAAVTPFPPIATDEFDEARDELDEVVEIGRPTSLEDQALEAGVRAGPDAAVDPAAEAVTEEPPAKPARSRSRATRSPTQKGREIEGNVTAEPAEATEEEAADEKPKRGRRGTRSTPTARKTSRPSRKPPTAAESPAADAPVITPSGSADKHLADDTPVDPEPPRRPRSYQDLDAVPDDYDE